MRGQTQAQRTQGHDNPPRGEVLHEVGIPLWTPPRKDDYGRAMRRVRVTHHLEPRFATQPAVVNRGASYSLVARFPSRRSCSSWPTERPPAADGSGGISTIQTTPWPSRAHEAGDRRMCGLGYSCGTARAESNL